MPAAGKTAVLPLDHGSREVGESGNIFFSIVVYAVYAKKTLAASYYFQVPEREVQEAEGGEGGRVR